jgi:phage tail P2-like protein
MIDPTQKLLRDDPRFSVLAKLSARQLHQQVSKVLPNLVALVQPDVLPYLVDQFHVADIDNCADDDARRELILSAIGLHRHKGTPWAVKQALRVLGFEPAISEWHQFGGQPGTFAVAADVFSRPVDFALSKTALDIINKAKNVRSHLVGIQLNSATKGTSPYTAAISTLTIITNIYPRPQSL